jgi:hypothetical protein
VWVGGYCIVKKRDKRHGSGHATRRPWRYSTCVRVLLRHSTCLPSETPWRGWAGVSRLIVRNHGVRRAFACDFPSGSQVPNLRQIDTLYT